MNRIRYTSASVRTLVLLVSALAITACSTVPVRQETEIPAAHPVSKYVKKGTAYPIDVYDPWEGMNRRIYKFNAKFDQYLFLPVVRGYEYITPEFMQTGVSNFFNNVREIRNITNSLLQFKGESLLKSTGRLLVNTTLGVVGLIDVATPMGMEPQKEDFGQTLAFYGVGNGPYLVIPIIGPSNVRDTTGMITDSVIFSLIDPFNFDQNSEYYPPYAVLFSVDTRHKNKFRYYQTGSPFEYDLVRFLYQKARQMEIGK
ncbi:ABC transporter [Desulfonema ishimotonii]|uniref:ABC transporter n=1 Tax=Desulfonema ishimotonii TaxID=45657 RepID=A0A401G3A0_9BACT|nr:VacJ family lipoprotein [Desulfonema ishimotonii]GBC63651.1 ABC transporter [Desulfonema ishimotonii]